MKRCVSVLMIVCMFFTCAVMFQGNQSHAVVKKNGFYTFYPAGDSPVEVKITKNKIKIIDNDATYKMRYKKKFHSDRTFNGNDKYMYGDQTFKLAKKVYLFTTEEPSHKVKKFGARFSVSQAKTVSRSKLYKKRHKLGAFYKYNGHSACIQLYMIVKNGKVVALGTAAGTID